MQSVALPGCGLFLAVVGICPVQRPHRNIEELNMRPVGTDGEKAQICRAIWAACAGRSSLDVIEALLAVLSAVLSGSVKEEAHIEEMVNLLTKTLLHDIKARYGVANIPAVNQKLRECVEKAGELIGLEVSDLDKDSLERSVICILKTIQDENLVISSAVVAVCQVLAALTITHTEDSAMAVIAADHSYKVVRDLIAGVYDKKNFSGRFVQ
jgi:hypothetical protein